MRWIERQGKARIATVENVILIDLAGLDPERDGEPGMTFAALIDELAKTHPSVTVLARLRDSKPPTSEGRAALRRAMLRNAERLGPVHIAIEDVGFLAATLRAALSAMAMLGMRSVNLELHSSLRDARRAFDQTAEVSATVAEPIDLFFADAELSAASGA
ncbi:MAG: hypothetical protein K0V04_15440 [Deltaproteobacteria bacterium]|nr:hypothetical protein [Deltaproteobacteria bacterium]